MVGPHVRTPTTSQFFLPQDPVAAVVEQVGPFLSFPGS